jgi:hypothetical protein
MYWYLKNLNNETISRNNLDEISRNQNPFRRYFVFREIKKSYFATTLIPTGTFFILYSTKQILYRKSARKVGASLPADSHQVNDFIREPFYETRQSSQQVATQHAHCVFKVQRRRFSVNLAKLHMVYTVILKGFRMRKNCHGKQKI